MVIATDEHPFWVPDLKAWVDAVDLVPGMWLQTSAGTWVQINAIQAWSQPATVHNLTVQGVHTYHVATGSLDVLNHNSNCNDNSLTRAQADDVVNYLGYTKTKIRSSGGPANLGEQESRGWSASLYHLRQDWE
ncbi:polymorphic toxin-type HINT domain-containing protein [Nocardiopsis sp. CC223A]|uniref:polymorphic toxin-type HINT domain-containing protein n=1 Tax=Nocardiopsis sp. CC223A TaxID=3044051 RepID=UPI002795D2AB|nr:polymorphic toxin-type HINT domain-containing protein [Nocardiopsis sp. CC223A]